MRKIIALILILVIIIPGLIMVSQIHYSGDFEIYDVKFDSARKYPKDKKWEYIKDRLFARQNEPYRPAQKFRSPILIELKNALPEDSIVVGSLVEELKSLLHKNDIDFLGKGIGEYYEKHPLKKKHEFKNGSSPIISLNFNEKVDEVSNINAARNLIFSYLQDGNIISRNSRVIGSDTFNYTNISFYLRKETPIHLREQYIRYEVLRSLCFIRTNAYDYSDYENDSVYNDIRFSPSNYRFSEADKFLLQKLYAKDFEEQFKDYIRNTYPLRYAFVYFHTNLSQQTGIIIVSILGIIILTLSFMVFYKRHFRYSYLSYFFPLLALVYSISTLDFFKFIWSHILNFPLSTTEIIHRGFLKPLLISVVLSLLLYGLDSILINKKQSFIWLLIFKMSNIFFATILADIILSQFSVRFYAYFQDELNNAVLFGMLLAIGRGLLIYLNHFSENLIKQKDLELSRLKEINTQSELKLLQSHINPHFLYNALNSIAGLAYTSPEKTEKMALSLSNLFRYSITNKGQQMSTVKEEVVMVQNYLEIENIRFGARLKFTLNVDADLENEEIPMYILQPLVENAIKHGVSQIRGEGLIILEIKNEGDSLLIRVVDNGPDFSNGLVSGHGLQTVYDLLRLSYGDKASLQWENAPVKNISISIPKN